MISNNSVIYNEVNDNGIFSAYFESNNNSIGLRQSQVLAGGESNIVSGNYAVVGGGALNTNNGYISTLGGGYNNCIIGNYASILGGVNNIATGNYSNVLGGSGNRAYGENSSILAGKYGRVWENHPGATVLGDGQSRMHQSRASNSLTLDFSNGVYMTGSIYLDGQNITNNIKNLGGKFTAFTGVLTQNITGVFV